MIGGLACPKWGSHNNHEKRQQRVMTQRDFEAVAATINKRVERAQDVNLNRGFRDAGAVAELENLAWDLCATFATLNPRFKAATFLTACGFGIEPDHSFEADEPYNGPMRGEGPYDDVSSGFDGYGDHT